MSDAEFRLRFFDLVVEKIYRKRRLFLCFVSFGRAKEMKNESRYGNNTQIINEPLKSTDQRLNTTIF